LLKYNLKPDIVTFGKCFGGGVPIGITCMNKQITIKLNKLKKMFFLVEHFLEIQFRHL